MSSDKAGHPQTGSLNWPPVPMVSFSPWLQQKRWPYLPQATINVKALDEAVEWYTTKLPFEVNGDESFNSPPPSNRQVLLRQKLPHVHSHSSRLLLVQRTRTYSQVVEEGKPDVGHRFILFTTDVDAACAALRTRGVEVREVQARGVRGAVFRDLVGTEWWIVPGPVFVDCYVAVDDACVAKEQSPTS